MTLRTFPNDVSAADRQLVRRTFTTHRVIPYMSPSAPPLTLSSLPACHHTGRSTRHYRRRVASSLCHVRRQTQDVFEKYDLNFNAKLDPSEFEKLRHFSDDLALFMARSVTWCHPTLHAENRPLRHFNNACAPPSSQWQSGQGASLWVSLMTPLSCIAHTAARHDLFQCNGLFLLIYQMHHQCTNQCIISTRRIMLTQWKVALDRDKDGTIDYDEVPTHRPDSRTRRLGLRCFMRTVSRCLEH